MEVAGEKANGQDARKDKKEFMNQNSEHRIQNTEYLPQGNSGWEFIQAIIIIALAIILARVQTLISESSSSSPSEQSAAGQKLADCSLFENDTAQRIGISLNSLSGSASSLPDRSFLNSVIKRLWQQESGSRLNPPAGDGGDAVGPLQLHPEVLLDVNKYYGTKFIDSDRRDLTKSKQIAAMYISMWLRRSDEEIAVRIFNGGPRGWASTSTDAYWKKYLKLKIEN